MIDHRRVVAVVEARMTSSRLPGKVLMDLGPAGLRDTPASGRADSEALQFWTKVANIALVPLLVALAGLGLAIIRRKRVVTV